ncbi:uncharacterized protein A4U43_C01F20590 [Asparagus officinalis]|uniref:Uncharacterized protein n=1 Tax=Asparagus officinalis TaxID=4686 RepID=A0A5P1FRP3_ASPOF|nr:uncharacterized protein A4U43_C01F20590 [Asparagus officinalis]
MSSSPISSSTTTECTLQHCHLRRVLRRLREETKAADEMDGEEHGEGVEEKEGEIKLIEPVRSMVMGSKGDEC